MNILNLLKLIKPILSAKAYRFIMNFYIESLVTRYGDYKALRQKRITPKGVEEVLNLRLGNDAGRYKVAIITDQEDVKKAYEKRFTVIYCDRDSHHFDSQMHDYYVYACENSDVGSAYIKSIIKGNKKFFPVMVGSTVPSRYLEDDIIAKSVLLDLYKSQLEEGFSKFAYGPGADFINICQMIEKTKHLRGDYVEIGCYRGSSGQVAVKFMREKNIARRAIFVDVFDGFNYTEAKNSSDAIWFNTHMTEGVERVRERLEKFANPEVGLQVEVRKANIISEDCLSDVDEIAVANIDVDMYEAVLHSLIRIFPKVVCGGAIIVEDPGHHPSLIGARVALDEFLNTLKRHEYFSIQMESGQFIILKA